MNPFTMPRRLAARTWPERWALFDAGALVVAFGLAVRTLPFQRVRRWASRAPAPVPTRVEYSTRIFPRAAGAIGRRLFPTHPCLPEALAVLWRTRGSGLHSELRIGLAKGEASELRAHAWVELDGVVLIGGSDAPEEYAPLRSPEDPS